MKELITRPQADTLIWGVAAFGVILGSLAALLARRRGQSAGKYGILVGGPLILCGVLWPLYNAIEDHFGLDSVAALALNGGLFVLIGAACGFGWTALFRKKS